MPHWVSFIIVYNGIGEVNRIGNTIFQSVEQLANHLLSQNLDFRLFQLRRRNHHFLGSLLQLDEFIEFQFKLRTLDIHLMQFRRASDKFRRHFIVWSTIRRSHAGTGITYDNQHQNQG